MDFPALLARFPALSSMNTCAQSSAAPLPSTIVSITVQPARGATGATVQPPPSARAAAANFLGWLFVDRPGYLSKPRTALTQYR